MIESTVDDVMIDCPKCNGTSDFNCCYTCAGTGRLPNPVFIDELARLRAINTDLRQQLAVSKAEVERLTLSNETEKFSTDSHKIDFSPSTPQAPRF